MSFFFLRNPKSVVPRGSWQRKGCLTNAYVLSEMLHDLARLRAAVDYRLRDVPIGDLEVKQTGLPLDKTGDHYVTDKVLGGTTDV